LKLAARISAIGVCYCIAMITASAAVTQVPANANLQQYLDAAQAGDTLVLPPGATYTGNFVLPVKNPKLGSDADYITIITAGFGQSSSAQRVSASNAPAMAKIVDPGNGLPAFLAPIYSHYWRLVGLEIFPATPQTAIYDLIDIGSYGSDQNTLAQAPLHFAFDQCYIHGWPNVNFKRGIAMNGGDISVTNSWISEFHSDFQEAQALDSGNGPGPFHIINNHLEGSAENVFFSSPPSIPGLVPTGIEIRQNHLYKPLSLKVGEAGFTGYTPWIKNFIEVKNGQDIVIDGNLMENNWVQAPPGNAQLGQAIVLGPRTGGTDFDVAVQRVAITNNVIRHVGGVITMAGVDDTGAQHIPANTVTFRNNLVDDIRNDYAYPGVGSLAIEVLGVSNVVIDHNDLFYPPQLSYLVVSPTDGQLVFTNNIFPFGVGLNSPCGWKAGALACMFPDGTINQNVAVSAMFDWMPAGTFEPANMDQVGFLNLAGGPSDYHNYALSASSPYHGAATDGSDVGVNFANIDKAFGSTSASPASASGQWVNIISVNSGKCLDVSGISTAPGAVLQQWTCWGGDNQEFLLTPVSGGYQITAKNSGLQLDVNGGPGAVQDGAQVIQYPFWGGSNEIWQLSPGPAGDLIIAQSSGKCLDIADISTSDGALAHQWSCWNGPNQQWRIVPVQ
jgi:hypothetical protein